jgi:hypothetical protein
VRARGKVVCTACGRTGDLTESGEPAVAEKVPGEREPAGVSPAAPATPAPVREPVPV